MLTGCLSLSTIVIIRIVQLIFANENVIDTANSQLGDLF